MKKVADRTAAGVKQTPNFACSVEKPRPISDSVLKLAWLQERAPAKLFANWTRSTAASRDGCYATKEGNR